MLLGILWAPSVCANRSENNHTRKQEKRRWWLRGSWHTGTRGGRDNQWGQLRVLGELAAVKRRVVSWEEMGLVMRNSRCCCQQSCCEWAYDFPTLHFQIYKTGTIAVSQVRQFMRKLRKGSSQTHLHYCICWFYQNCLQGQRSITPETAVGLKPIGRKALERSIFENGLQEG